ncbi:MAG: hypothetical protein WCR06_04880 [bacterium]
MKLFLLKRYARRAAGMSLALIMSGYAAEPDRTLPASQEPIHASLASADGDTVGQPAWQLAGPCARDHNGNMWAFLAEYPDKLSRHDGQRWIHIYIALGTRIPQQMTSDDKGRLQIDFQDYPAGSCLVSNGNAITWFATPTLAWIESVKTGAKSLNDGSPYRYRHVIGGKADWLWTYAGRSLWEAGREYEYYESPPYRHFWIGTNGICYRSGAGPVWALVNGRWNETQMPPLSIGPDGIRACTEPGRLPVIYDGQPELPLPGASAGSKPRVLTLQGNEAFLPAADGGGWLGQYRIFRHACYELTGRAYPGTNGQYLVVDKTLRFQAQQKLTVTGEVLSDGSQRRLVCRIAGTAPLHKPRLLAFLDGEFCEALADPAGADLPPLPSGQHTLEVYAADGFGVVSDQPLRLTVDGGPLLLSAVQALDDAWSLKPQRLQALPAMAAGRSVLGRALEIDSDGVVWILTEGGILSIDMSHRQAAFNRLSARGLLSARGRVWAHGDYDKARMRVPLYELRSDGPRHAVDLDGAPGAADPAGGIWVLSKTSAARWDGQRTQYWERNFGSGPELLPHPAGVVIQSPWDGFCHVYRNGELSAAISGYRKIDGYHSPGMRTSAWPLGLNHLVMVPTGEVVDLSNGRAIDMKFPYGVYSRGDSRGNVYFWDKGQLFRLSGEDLTQTKLGPARRPMSQSEWGHGAAGWYDAFLATLGGTVVYSAGPDRLVALRSGEVAAEYSLAQGVLPGRTRAICEAPDGRIWILRNEQLLVYDPAQPVDALPSGWPGWRGIPVSPIVMVGAAGRFWYEADNLMWLTCTDGTNETSWCLGVSGEVIISDQMNGVVFSGNDTYLISPDRNFTRGTDRQSAILDLLKRGGKRFEGDKPPVVAADGRVYFRGQIWDGKTWHPVPEGRASLDLRGELHLLCQKESSPPVAYRIDGVTSVPAGEAEQCLIDADGLRWYDPGLMESNPGCLPVWRAGNGSPQISTATTSQRIALKRNAALQAFPLGTGRFLVRVDSMLHVLDATGLTALPKDRVPFSGGARKIYRLANGRWVFVSVNGTLFISPPDLNLDP